MRSALLALAVSIVLWPGAARADPCKAVPDRGATPQALRAGRVFSGPVGYVGDGDSLCVQTRLGLVEVRLADFNAPELREPGGVDARDRLSRLTLRRRLRCVAVERTYDRIAARCTLGGKSLGDVLRRAGGIEGGR